MASDNFLQEKFDLAIKLVIAERRDTTTDTYLRNRLTLLLYKLEHKELLTEFEAIVLIEIGFQIMTRRAFYGKDRVGNQNY